MKLSALFLFLALTGCGQAETNFRSFRYLDVGGKTEASAIIDGVAIEFDPSVHVRFSLNTGVLEITTDGDSSEVWMVNGQPFGIEDGEFHIGKKRYGAVRSGDRVSVAADGVTVNGEARGSLPVATENPEHRDQKAIDAQSSKR